MDEGCARAELGRLEDQLNVRCHAPKQRFGIDGRFPTSRYIEGFSSPTLSDGRAESVVNPLFASHRLLDSVRLLGIVGVPWQFVATDESASVSDELELLSPEQLVSEGRWPMLLEGDGEAPDPHLVESLLPRPGLAPPESEPNADPIHGHEYENPNFSDLQYSCIFSLAEPRDCSVDTDACDCTLLPDDTGELAPTSPNRPLCQAEDGSYGETQYFGKAYPAPRLLEVLRETRGVVGSVCPKTADPDQYGSSAYGYTAAFRSLTEEFTAASGMSCLKVAPPTVDGKLSDCRVLEMVDSELGCDVAGRRTAPEAYAKVLRARMLPREADDLAFCELLPAEGDPEDPKSPAYSCLNDVEVSEDAYGYCLVDPDRGLGNPELVERCPSNAQRRLRLVPYGIGRPDPLGNSALRLVCL
jgi:hypothetical protein